MKRRKIKRMVFSISQCVFQDFQVMQKRWENIVECKSLYPHAGEKKNKNKILTRNTVLFCSPTKQIFKFTERCFLSKATSQRTA